MFDDVIFWSTLIMIGSNLRDVFDDWIYLEQSKFLLRGCLLVETI